MTSGLKKLALAGGFLLVYFALQLFVLPRLGIQT